MNIDTNIYHVNSPSVINETIEGESVIINLELGFYYSLEGAGAEIWDLLLKQIPVSEIIDIVKHKYNAHPDEISTSVNGLVNELIEEKLIVAVDNEAGKNVSKIIESDHNVLKIEFVTPKLHKFSDMQDLLLLDPIHEVDEAGWPYSKDEHKSSNP